MNTPFVAVVFPGPLPEQEVIALGQRIVDIAQRLLPEPAKPVRGDFKRMCFLFAGDIKTAARVLDEACSSKAEWLLVQAGPDVQTRGLVHDGTWLQRHTPQP
jgi:hypothetical protein